MYNNYPAKNTCYNKIIKSHPTFDIFVKLYVDSTIEKYRYSFWGSHWGWSSSNWTMLNTNTHHAVDYKNNPSKHPHIPKELYEK